MYCITLFKRHKETRINTAPHVCVERICIHTQFSDLDDVSSKEVVAWYATTLHHGLALAYLKMHFLLDNMTETLED